MVNKNLFSTEKKAPVANTTNLAGGKAYSLSDQHALAQIACTGTFNGTYYANEEQNLEMIKRAVDKCDPEFVAKLAVYARSKGYMKDLPAYMVAWLSGKNTELFRKVFPRVIDNGKMLRNAVQIARSGQLGRTFNMSAGTWRNALGNWFTKKSSAAIFRASVGNDPTLEQIIKMGRPKPENDEKRALYGYLLGKEYNREALPSVIKQYESFKQTKKGEVPNVDFRLLDSLGLDKDQWTQVALNAGWTMLRMNLNTFQRHGVFEDKKVVAQLIEKLTSREEIQQARAFPYQLFTAYQNTLDVPVELRNALQDAMEIATENTPTFNGKVVVAVDVSGSMSSPVMGRAGAPSKTRCIDVAGLFGSCVIRKNPNAVILPFDTRIHATNINPRDSVVTNAQKLSSYGGGGTNCALPIEYLLHHNLKTDGVVFISDNESWVDTARYSYGGGTGLMNAWTKYKAKNKQAKLVCIDIHATTNSQVSEHEDILQVGGFSDNVFEVVNSFLEHGHGKSHWVEEIEKVEL